MALSFGKIFHALGMDGPLPPGIEVFTQLADFDWSLCNLKAETWTSNMAVCNRDDRREEIRSHFLTHFRKSNPAIFPDHLRKLPSNQAIFKRPATDDFGEDDEDIEGEEENDGLTFTLDDLELLDARIEQQDGESSDDTESEEKKSLKMRKSPRKTQKVLRQLDQTPMESVKAVAREVIASVANRTTMIW